MDKKNMISAHISRDWCHLCGKCNYGLADIWYPNNAEHENLGESGQRNKYVRICHNCATEIWLVSKRSRDGVLDITTRSPSREVDA